MIFAKVFILLARSSEMDDPLILEYVDDDGKLQTREEIIFNAVWYYTRVFIEKFESKPSKKMVERWTRDLYNAYESRIDADQKIYNNEVFKLTNE